MINLGNYRRDLFADPGAAESFEVCLAIEKGAAERGQATRLAVLAVSCSAARARMRRPTRSGFVDAVRARALTVWAPVPRDPSAN